MAKKSPRSVGIQDLFFQAPHGAAVAVARWGQLVLLALLAVGTLLFGLLVLGLYPAMLLIAVAAAVLGWVMPLRGFVQRRAWCVVTRSRLYSAFIESRIHSRNGHLPVITRITPTKVGERVSVWCPAGVSITDFEGREPMLAAACYARSARVSVNKAKTHKVTVEIVRRDTLAQDQTVAPTLLDRLPSDLPDSARAPVSITPEQVINR